jgi:hypothetical protein
MNKDWYNERNRRTDSFAGVTESCHDIKVKVVVTANTNDYGTQVMLRVLLNILARWCYTIEVTSDDTVDLLTAADTDAGLLTALKKMLSGIDPNGRFTFNEPSDGEVDITVFIGLPAKNHQMPYIAIDGHGWVSSCSFNAFGECDKSTISNNPIGPSFAACLANAELFRWANRMECAGYTKWYSLYDMSVEDHVIVNNEELPDLDLGRVHIVGCGAIGSSFTYLLNLTNFTGELTFVDADEAVELHNTSSSLLFNLDNLAGEKTKSLICAEHLSSKGFVVHPPFNGDYNDFGYAHDKQTKSADMILCFANDHNIWSTIQHLYPPVVFHATTSRSWGLNIGRHIPLKDNCIMCTFQDLATKIYVPKCAEVEMPGAPVIIGEAEQKEPHASILPFLSPAAAIITFAEVGKLLMGKLSNENTTQFNMSTKEGNFIEDQHRAKGCYICKDQSPAIYESLKVKLNY